MYTLQVSNMVMWKTGSIVGPSITAPEFQVKGNYFLNPWEWHQTHGFYKGEHYYSDEIIAYSLVNGFVLNFCQ